MPLSPPDLDEFAFILSEQGWYGDTKLKRALLHFAQSRPDWSEILKIGDEDQFYRRRQALNRWMLRAAKHRLRLEQLQNGKYRWWVYCSDVCQQEGHAHLNAMAVSTDHDFWKIYYPANGWTCCCEVYGARTVAGIRRVGGDPERSLPIVWNATDPATGLFSWVESGFEGQVHPDLAACIAAILRGEHNRFYD